ncbi:MAG: DUF480 domain-containing protein [Planctomycetaceae bacterium]|nr:DUF480 domain-containing protein [Planctomycetaceae bacterium]
MDSVHTESDDQPGLVRTLTRCQRRVLGVLVEKAFTVPGSYPMTLQAVMTGANQKSNRSPVTNYSEDQLWQALEELRGMGLVGLIETETGRTERFRHYIRKRFPFSEPQIAIIAELLLRGRQQPGELRARASRMVKIEGQEDLRSELEGLMELGFLQANGDLGRRGVEVDHTFYEPAEGMDLSGQPAASGSIGGSSAAGREGSPGISAASTSDSVGSVSGANERLQAEVDALKEAFSDLRSEFDDLKARLDGLL